MALQYSIKRFIITVQYSTVLELGMYTYPSQFIFNRIFQLIPMMCIVQLFYYIFSTFLVHTIKFKEQIKDTAITTNSSLHGPMYVILKQYISFMLYMKISNSVQNMGYLQVGLQFLYVKFSLYYVKQFCVIMSEVTLIIFFCMINTDIILKY